MADITETDWSFKELYGSDCNRAGRLEDAGSPDTLVTKLQAELTNTISRGSLRVAVDSPGNQFVEKRVTIQFQVPPDIYDWFFNARTGYRAQFWKCPDVGATFNKQIIEALSCTLHNKLPDEVSAKKINVSFEKESRYESYEGEESISREIISTSIKSSISKIWIAERLYGAAAIENIGLAVLMDAARNLPKLCIPRWQEEGCRAPYPAECQSWLDLKGAFVHPKGHVHQIKSQQERAETIHRSGWT